MSRLAELGDDSVSQKGVRGLEFKAVLADLLLRLGVAPRFMPGGTHRVREVLDVSKEDPRESVNTYRLADRGSQP